MSDFAFSPKEAIGAVVTLLGLVFGASRWQSAARKHLYEKIEEVRKEGRDEDERINSKLDRMREETAREDRAMAVALAALTAKVERGAQDSAQAASDAARTRADVTETMGQILSEMRKARE